MHVCVDQLLGIQESLFNLLGLCKAFSQFSFEMQCERVGRTLIAYEIRRASFSFLTCRYIKFQEIGGATVC